MIKQLNHSEIDKAKWDECIINSQFPIAYAYSSYLDSVSPQWKALVIEEDNQYEAVFPLTEKQKWGIKYLTQPYFCQQLGLFHRQKTKTSVEDFLSVITSSYKHYEISLNESNTLQFKPNYSARTNLVLDLSLPYQDLYSSFSTNRKRDLKKAQNLGVEVERSTDIESFINFFIEQKANEIEGIAINDFNLLSQIFKTIEPTLQPFIVNVSNSKREILSSCLFIDDGKRIIFLIGTSNDEGKKNGVMTFIFNDLIRQYAGNNRDLDFEGSNIEGVAKFYKSLGGKQKKYISLKGNSFLWGVLAPRIAKLIQR